tara:strand:- start:335 stop:643 length:309 start_codon:yes stop_codon:yes gene_type:complete
VLDFGQRTAFVAANVQVQAGGAHVYLLSWDLPVPTGAQQAAVARVNATLPLLGGFLVTYESTNSWVLQARALHVVRVYAASISTLQKYERILKINERNSFEK